MKKYTKASQVAFIREMITTNKQWSQRALLTIFNNQTEDEKDTAETKHENGIGFNGNDAYLLTSFATSLQKYGSLTDKQMPYLFHKIGKYAGQLYNLSDKDKLIKAMETATERK